MNSFNEIKTFFEKNQNSHKVMRVSSEFNQNIEKLEKAVNENFLTQTEFKYLTSYFNRVLEYHRDTVMTAIMNGYKVNKQLYSMFYDYYAYNVVYVSKVAGMVKKLKAKGTPEIVELAEIKQFYEDFLPISEKVKLAKSFIGKKVSEKERKEEYMAELAKGQTVKLFKEKIENYLSDIKDEMFDMYKDYYLNLIKKVILKVQTNDAEYKSINNEFGIYFGSSEFFKFFKKEGTKLVVRTDIDLEEEIKKQSILFSEKNTKFTIDTYLARLIKKVSLIFEKNNLKIDIDIKNHNLSFSRLETTIKVYLSDKTNFILTTSLEYGISKNGTNFIRYPTRFSEVIIDGVILKNPSFEKVVKTFKNN